MTSPSTPKNNDIAQLDRLTGGAFTAPTSGERAARVREWLQSNPSADQLADVFRELSVKDKGAAKPVRERIDEARRLKAQEIIAAEWAAKAQSLLDMGKLNIADALAWQRDAAKAGAPLSREPLASLKVQLVERVRVIEDLQRRVQVQREAAVLLAQRIEVLSTKSWKDAQAALEALRVDVEQWQTQAVQLTTDSNWNSVDGKFPTQLEGSKAQLWVVWEAFGAAVTQAAAAAEDAAAPLPTVPVWADELRTARGIPLEAVAKPPKAPKPAKPAIDPEVREKANAAVREVLVNLEKEVAEGHGKATTGAANALRQVLKEHGKAIDDVLEAQVHAALVSAGELEGWQRWRADQLRENLVVQAEALLKRPEGQSIGGRKMQETLRSLREQWKQTDQGGIPNHGLWKRFDEACNEAYKVVEAWLEKIRAEAAEHKAQRLALIAELNAWAEANPTALNSDWKGFNRILHQFADRWRDAGHLGEKAFAELQPQWKTAIAQAAAPLEAVQAQSIALRHAMIDEAKALGAAAELRVDAVKALQQRWQTLAHSIPMDRRQEQKLWDAFRKPIDEAFARKTTQRAAAEAALGERDRTVLQAAKALDVANASGDAQAIRTAMEALDAALRNQVQESSKIVEISKIADNTESTQNTENTQNTDDSATALVDTASAATEVVAEKPVVVAPKRVVAARGDDRPTTQKEVASAPIAPSKFAKSRDSRDSRDSRPAREPREFREFREPRESAPRLGETAFRAQREALEHAQAALRKLAAQAHGEIVTQWLSAWEKRDTTLVPAPTRSPWIQALNAEVKAKPAQGRDPHTALLRLEIAAEVPTPAEDLIAHRTLKLQLLTKRNDPSPAQTWEKDMAIVLESAYQNDTARRVQNVLKVLLKK
ncbi:MAG: hypothetical protein RIR79_898 [Pseudomonadota bacterium]